MPSRWMGALVAIAGALALSFAALAQNGKQKGAPSNQNFDPHDLSGYWDITKIGLPAGALNSTSNNRPPMTPWGQEKFRKAKSGYDGKVLGNGIANEKDWNDPVLLCDPTGFPRIMWHPIPPGMRFAQTNEEVLQFFEDGRTWRDIWTDGRKLPSPDADLRWYGYSVGHWEGDTFVVNSNGFDESTWLDQYGSPHSDEMTVEERYRRVSRDRLEMTLNITDPKTYTGVWKGDTKIFQRVEKPRSVFNDFDENICAYSEVKLHGKAWEKVHPKQ